MSKNYGIINFNFQVNPSDVSDGNELKISADMLTMNIFITGDATASTCIFEGKDLDGNWYAVKCANLTTLTLATQTTGINEVWQVDLTAWVGFRVRISALTLGEGQSVNIKGKVVN